MNILSIETSCDETALSIIQRNQSSNAPNIKVLSNLVISQIDTHAEYGGVFPALAKREHARNLCPLLVQTLKEAGLYSETDTVASVPSALLKEVLHREPELLDKITALFTKIEKPEIHAIYVTQGPGLSPALWVGVNFARALALVWNIPILPVNHMEGHITSILFKEDYANKEQALYNIDEYHFPMIALLISGGHTQLVLVKAWGEYEIVGETIDDAVGEAFDKVARMLGMSYPGGPKLSQAALKGVPHERVKLPRPMLSSGDLRFSFSGLKTAVRYLIDDLKEHHEFDDTMIANIALSFQEAVTDVLVHKTKQAMIEYGAKGLIIGGGVSANTHITSALRNLLQQEFHGTPFYLPQKNLCGDNSLMIASAGFIHHEKYGSSAFVDPDTLQAQANLRL